jgi:ribosomal protein S18 acetylase RimI-like enzyme
MSEEPRGSQADQTLTPGLRVRAMRTDDLPAAAAVSADAFGIDIHEPPLAARWQQRVAHPLSTDPQGAFVAEQDGSLIGVAQALARERLWCLSLLAVSPQGQSSGAGRALLESALAYRAATEAGLITSSDDPRALRLYALAGFSLRPTFEAAGTIDRSALPRPAAQVSEGGVADLDELASISREVRGAPHTLELEFALRGGAQLMRFGDRGYVVVRPGHAVWLLVARDEAAAAALLWSALAVVGETERPMVRWITGAQQWAIEIVLRAGLQLASYGALCVRGRPGPLRPFLPSPPFA